MNIAVIRSRRRTLALQVRQSGEVVVRAPLFVREQEVRRFVEEHLAWIEKQQRKLACAAEQRREIQPLSKAELSGLTEQARRDLTERARLFAPRVGVTYGRISIRHQKTKWGSCSSKGNLNFNCLLMLAPEAVRDYVVVHELCHRKQMNHSEAFWAEVERVLPEYRQARKWLKMHGQELMQYNTEN
ncbi:MAG TPA: metal-dependent hydrolase [Lachnospiraceae bacterium]|nr:metal-dependent hydrolase [Lachnospiraceae bacterium]